MRAGIARRKMYEWRDRAERWEDELDELYERGAFDAWLRIDIEDAWKKVNHYASMVLAKGGVL